MQVGGELETAQDNRDHRQVVVDVLCACSASGARQLLHSLLMGLATGLFVGAPWLLIGAGRQAQVDAAMPEHMSVNHRHLKQFVATLDLEPCLGSAAIGDMVR